MTKKELNSMMTALQGAFEKLLKELSNIVQYFFLARLESRSYAGSDMILSHNASAFNETYKYARQVSHNICAWFLVG